MSLWKSDLFIDLARVQQEERVQRRDALDRELSGRDAQDCLDRVRRRMREGDKVWIPPMHNRTRAFLEWRRRHRSHRKVTHITDRKEA